jgi:hypothetical protein
MMTTSETADHLRAEATRLQNAAQKLLEAAEVLDGQQQKRPKIERIRLNPAPEDNSDHAGNGTRAEQLRRYLRLHPGARRRAIIEGTRMPVGTIAYLLKPANGFERDESGGWTVAKNQQDSEG